MAYSMGKFHDSEDAPKIMSLQLLSDITNNFSEERKLGSGTYGEVFKGVQNGKEVAVKMLRQMPGLVDDLEQFQKEFENLKRLRHENIVQLLGYCYETRHEYVNLSNGKGVFAQNIYRALCFEYMHNGSLQKHLYDEYHGHDWQTRYKIIKGICKGLKYLHEGLESPIYHLDLKPDNILLDKAMVPKLADFGLSKLVCNDQTQATQSPIGTRGYLPPEYIEENFVSKKFDIFSLGVVMIRIMTGYEGYHKKAEMSSQEFIDLVHNNWRNRLQAMPGCTSLEDTCHQVKRCTEIALNCVKADRKQRPEIGAIIHWLNETENMKQVIWAIIPYETRHDFLLKIMMHNSPTCLRKETRRDTVLHIDKTYSTVYELVDEVPLMVVSAKPSSLQRIISAPTGFGETTSEITSLGSTDISKLLDVHPLELCFPFEPQKVIECPVTLINMTDCHVGVWITSTDDQYACSEPRFPELWKRNPLEDPCSSLSQMIMPHSSWSVPMTVEEWELPSQDKGEFEVVMIVMRTGEDLQILKSSIGSKMNMDKSFWNRVEVLGAEVHRAMLRAVICDPASCQQAVVNQKFIPVPSEFGEVSCIDVHPTETWVLVGQRGGRISILNYDMLMQHREIVLQMQVTKREHMLSYFTHNSSAGCHITSAKFIAREGWVAIGDDDGWFHVYYYTTKKGKVKQVDAHHGKTVSSLAVHPTLPFFLTSSSFDNWIKLWDWGKDWKCIRKFDNERFPSSIMWNPQDTNTFAGASFWGVKIWGIHSSNPINTLAGLHQAPCCFYSDGHKNFMVTSSCSHGYHAYMHNTAILDMQTNEHVHHLAVATNQQITDVACHPMLPILVTMSDSSVCLWDTSSYRLENMVNFTDHPVRRGMVITGTKNITRLVIGFQKGISVMEFKLPTIKEDVQTAGRRRE